MSGMFFLTMILATSNRIKKNVTTSERTAYATAEMFVVPVVMKALIAVMIERMKLMIEIEYLKKFVAL